MRGRSGGQVYAPGEGGTRKRRRSRGGAEEQEIYRDSIPGISIYGRTALLLSMRTRRQQLAAKGRRPAPDARSQTTALGHPGHANASTDSAPDPAGLAQAKAASACTVGRPVHQTPAVQTPPPRRGARTGVRFRSTPTSLRTNRSRVQAERSSSQRPRPSIESNLSILPPGPPHPQFGYPA